VTVGKIFALIFQAYHKAAHQKRFSSPSLSGFSIRDVPHQEGIRTHPNYAQRILPAVHAALRHQEYSRILPPGARPSNLYQPPEHPGAIVGADHMGRCHKLSYLNRRSEYSTRLRSMGKIISHLNSGAPRGWCALLGRRGPDLWPWQPP
jgi:hypothetical protein